MPPLCHILRYLIDAFKLPCLAVSCSASGGTIDELFRTSADLAALPL
eukprot:SAG11_NODE_1146_length_5684_cov_59.423277_5_plen_47_part_00